MMKTLLFSIALQASFCVCLSHGASCACEAESHGFDINCGDQGATIKALATLQSNNCQADCSSETCRRNYFIIQTHHDYCLENQVHPTVERDLHDFEDACEDCEISRQPNPNFPSCPEISCKVDGPGSNAYQALLTGGCLADCSFAACVENYRLLVAVHNTCPEDSLNQDAEEGIHDFEDPCENQGCNVVTNDGGSQLVCLESVAASGSWSASLRLCLAVVAAALIIMTMVY